MESICLDSPPPLHTDSDWDLLDTAFDAPQTPSSTGDEAEQPAYIRGAGRNSDSDNEGSPPAHDELRPRRKPGGYDSRIEQILYENPELPILITDAGKSLESGGRYIVYTIRTGVSFLLQDPIVAAILTRPRTWRFGDDTQSSPLCVTP